MQESLFSSCELLLIVRRVVSDKEQLSWISLVFSESILAVYYALTDL